MPRGFFRRNKNRPPSSSILTTARVPEPVRQPTPANSDNEDPDWMTEDQKRHAKIAKKKAAVPQKAAAEPKPKPTTGAKAPKPKEGQESPEAKASHPMATRKHEASRAGGLRSVGGSGQTGTCVASRNPPKT
jgi:hypothetical protein